MRTRLKICEIWNLKICETIEFFIWTFWNRKNDEIFKISKILSRNHKNLKIVKNRRNFENTDIFTKLKNVKLRGISIKKRTSRYCVSSPALTVGWHHAPAPSSIFNRAYFALEISACEADARKFSSGIWPSSIPSGKLQISKKKYYKITCKKNILYS